MIRKGIETICTREPAKIRRREFAPKKETIEKGRSHNIRGEREDEDDHFRVKPNPLRSGLIRVIVNVIHLRDRNSIKVGDNALRVGTHMGAVHPVALLKKG